jgi:small ligand-binding sensory domain FIST
MRVRHTKSPTSISARSNRSDTREAARDLAVKLRASMAFRPDILVMFGSFHHRALFSDALDILRSELHPAHVLACTTRNSRVPLG